MTLIQKTPTGKQPSENPPRKRGFRRALQVSGWTMIWLGVFILVSTGYQLWGTGLQTAQAQVELEEQLSTRQLDFEAVSTPAPTIETGPPLQASDAGSAQPPSDTQPTVSSSPEVLAEPAPGIGEAVGRIVIPSADVDDVIVEGVDTDTLKKGPGHMPRTPLPGQPGNAVISGHRTTYGAPFFYLDRLEVGDEIFVDTLLGRHTYEVRETLVVEPTDVWVTDPRPGAWLTLTTCTPRYSAAQRLIIFAEMVDGPNQAAIAAQATEPLE